MTLSSARALLWLALLLILVAAMIPAPALATGLAGLGAILALAPVVFGSRGLRIAGIVALLAALWLATSGYPDARTELQLYRDHARQQQ